MSKHRSLPSYVKDAPFGNGAPFIFLLIGLALSLLASPSPVAAYIPTGYQEYYVNGYEEHLWRMYMAINDNHTDPALTPGNICSTVSLVATANYQVIYYDHWEDGYESDLFNPVQATTEVYGDGVTGNGGTGTDILVAGDDINLVSVNSGATKHSYVPVNPNRNPAQIRYDGGDRVISTGGPVALAHAVWPYNASWVGDAFEIYSRQAQEGAYSYRLPIGQDLYTFGGGDTGSYGDFRDVYLQLQAFEDNTTVLIDNGAQAVNMTLNRGQTYSSMGYIDSSPYASLTINSGTRVHANKATQAVLITGADGTYQGRSFTVLSDRLWGSDYVVPVPSGAGTASPAEVYLSNPNDFPITVNGYDRFASTTFVISPTGYVSATVPYSRKRPGNAYVPGDSAARFTSADGVFGVFVAAGTSDSNYDWGASGMPSRYLTHDYYVSWAPGSDAVPPANNGSPVWVTPLENDTVFFVDYNTASGLDGVVDETFVLDVLEQRRVFDPDNDNTGMHIWASSEFAVFWGEDPRTAGVYNPYLDIGLTVLPARREWLAPMLALDKTVAPTSLPISGGAVTFTLVAQAINAFMSNVDVTDTLPANWSYVAGSALIQYPDGSSASQTPAISGQTLAWNLSYDLDINQSLTITFQAQTSAAGSYDDTAYDGFENNSYSGGSGWVGNWTEVGEIDGVGAGFVRVVGTEIGGTPAYTPCQGSYQLRIWDDSRRIYRVVNLSSFSAPILRFMRRYIVSSNDENFFLEISPDNSTWTQVRNWVNNSGNENTWVEEIIDLTPYRSATTYIRFSSRQAATMEDTDRLYIDQVKVYEGGLLNVNRGEASGIEPYSGALFNPTDEAVVYISPLKLTKAVNRSQAEIGHTLVYTLSYQNTSATSDATNVVLRDSVPVRYVTFLSATGGGTFDAASGTITWSLGTLAPLSSDSVSFQVQVNSFGKDGQVIKNVGRIESDEAVETRSNEVLTFLVEAPEIELVKDGPTVAYSGERITYTLSYENTGGARATNVVISDTLPVSVTYVGGSLEINTGSGWVARGSLSGPTLVIQPGVVSGTVEAGETGVIRFCVDLDSSLMAGELIMNWAVYDRDLDRPRDTNLVVTRISDLLLSKSAQQTAVAPGDVITYTLTYRNTGTVAHDNIVLREPIPDYTRFVGANTPAGLTLQYSVDN
ncbi:MAG: DUF11 domain-containing protein, partial [Thermoflexales bacterium]|nr:DUF11 domain-containing protein [Thermoflexales bacterium]